MNLFIALIISVMLTGCVTPEYKATSSSSYKSPEWVVTEIVDAPKEPMPRVELGTHSVAIAQISLDLAGKWLASVSYDSTIRVWDALTGKLEGIIRPPIGQGAAGVGLVAISPDGNLVAGIGTQFRASPDNYLARPKDGSYIYLFNRTDGRMVASIGEQSGIIMNFNFSPDGQHLGVAIKDIYHRACLLRIFKVQNNNGDAVLKLVAEAIENDMGSPSFDFSSDGKKLIMVFSNKLQLYDLSKLVVDTTDQIMQLQPVVLGGVAVSSGSLKNVKFSPDNNKIAVSFLQSSKISVFSASDLKALYTHENPDVTKRVENRHIAWSRTGESLFACFKTTTGGYLIRRWDKAGRGEHKDHVLEAFKKDGISEYMNYVSIVSHPNNSLIISSPNDPILTSFVHNGKTDWTTGTTLSQLTNSSSFMLSKDGSTVAFNASKGSNTKTFGFSIQERSLIADFDTSKLHSPKESAAVNMDASNKNIASTAGMQTLTALAADEKSMIVGVATFFLRKCSSSTVTHNDMVLRCIWHKTVLSPIKAVNLSQDGKLAAAALADGTIRWYRYSDGEEVATLLIHPDRKRWIIYTPEGYFDASPGGAELMGYHINQGKTKEAMFISISNLYDVFYRPDIVQAKVRGEDISSLITMTAAEALKTPPPEVKFTTIPAKGPAVKAKVCYQVKSTGGGIGEVRVFQNGKLIKSDGFYREVVSKESAQRVQLASLNSRAIYQDQRGLIVQERKNTDAAGTKIKGGLVDECIEIEPISGENEISIAAFNAPNTVQGLIETTTFTSTRKADAPHLYILSVGIDTYRDSSIDLKYAAKDAKDFMAKLPEKARSIYKKENIHLITLINQQAGKQNIMKTINELSARVKHGDGFIFFNASHGVLLQNQYYIVTADFDGNIANTNTLVSSNEIVEMSKQIKSLSQLFIFDTCHAGGVDNIVSGLYDARMVNLARKMGLHIYASAGSVQSALDGYKGNGLYTHTLLQGIENGKDVDTEKSGKVTVKSLGLYTKEKTAEISTKLGHPQTPFIINFGRDNPLFTVVKAKK